MSKTKPKPETEIVHFRIAKKTMDAVRTYADEAYRTYGEQLRMIVSQWVDDPKTTIHIPEEER